MHAPKIKYCPIELDVASINKDTNCIYCTPIISPNATDKNIIMHQLKSFIQNIYRKNKQLDGMSNIYDSNNVFSITSRIGKVSIKT